MERTLASVQKITAIDAIPGADAIEVASVLGWKVVVAKTDGFKSGEFATYIELDSFLPIKPQYEWLRKSSYRKLADGSEGFRIKTIKLRGQVSQGLLLPISVLAGVPFAEGADVTNLLGIIKYEPPIPACMSGLVKGSFPSYVPKTDEMRIQSVPEVLTEMAGKPYYASVKIDGTSGTFMIKDGEIDVCSRNLSLKEDEKNVYWQMYKKYNIEAILKEYGRLAIQGEVAGLGIAKNPVGLKELTLFVFNVYDIEANRYYNYAELVAFCKKHNLQTVPIVCDDKTFDFTTVETMIEFAKGKYPLSGKNREGVVIRPLVEAYSPALKGRLSFKVINNDYLLKEEE